MINKELAQRIVVNNNENSEKMTNFIETSEDKIKQLNSNFKNVESKENQWDNNNKCKKRRFDYLCNTSNNFCNKNKKMYIFDGPTITSRDIDTKNQ